MQAALYFKDNGFGLTQDAKVVARILKGAGYYVLYRSPYEPIDSDISIHFEIPSLGGIKRSGRSIFFPNFEWFFWDYHVLGYFDVLACKTKHAIPIAKRFSHNVIYTGFASEDMFAPHMQRKLEFYHIAGRSKLKNTLDVLRCWHDNPDFPLLHLYTHVYNDIDVPTNVKLYFGPTVRSHLQMRMNTALVGVHPSATEGFGQVLWEVLSTGGLLITTDAEPMSEVPANFFVPGYENGKHNLQTMYQINPDELAEVVKKIIQLKQIELEFQSLKSRSVWIENYNNFVDRFLEII